MRVHYTFQGARAATWRRFSSSSGGAQCEFTLAPYQNCPKLGFENKGQFCMLTLQHPAFQDSITKEMRASLYETKKTRTSEHVDNLFAMYDADSRGALDSTQLREAMAGLGLQTTDFQVADIMSRRATSTGLISREMFTAIVDEAWGRSKDVDFSDRLGELNYSDGHAALLGTRAILWLGRGSPMSWILRSMRGAWPESVGKAALLRNSQDNPQCDPRLMQTFCDTVSDTFSNTHGPRTIEDLAHEAAAKLPTEAGGFVLRLSPVDAEAIHIPVRGLPENEVVSAGRGWLAEMGGWMSSGLRPASA